MNRNIENNHDYNPTFKMNQVLALNDPKDVNMPHLSWYNNLNL